MYKLEEVDTLSDDSNHVSRRMDAGHEILDDDFEEYDDEVPGTVDAATAQDSSDAPEDQIQFKDKVDPEEMKLDESNKIENDEVDIIVDTEDIDTLVSSTQRTTVFTPPRPVFVVYPDPVPVTTNPSISLESSTKMFDIDYDQFS